MDVIICKFSRFWYNEFRSKFSDVQLEYFCNCASETIRYNGTKISRTKQLNDCVVALLFPKMELYKTL
jgi:hypothetical protein